MPPGLRYKLGYVTSKTVDRRGQFTGTGIYVRPVDDLVSVLAGSWASISIEANGPNGTAATNQSTPEKPLTSAGPHPAKRGEQIDDDKGKEVAIVLGTLGGTFVAVLPFGIIATKPWWPHV